MVPAIWSLKTRHGMQLEETFNSSLLRASLRDLPISAFRFLDAIL